MSEIAFIRKDGKPGKQQKPAHQDRRLFIANVYDCPSEKFIAEKRADGKLYYIHPALRTERKYWGMEPSNPTPLEDFGIETEISDGKLRGRKRGPSAAEYQDGRLRPWQGEPEFSFSLGNV